MTVEIAIIALLFAGGAVLVVAGIYMLTGMAWAFIASGLLLFGAGVYFRARLTPNG